MKSFRIHFFFLLFLLSQLTIGQYIEQYPLNAANAAKMMEIKNYQEAIRQYKALVNEEPQSVEFKHELGKAYSLSNINPSAGLELLFELYEAKAYSNGLKADLAYSYFRNYEFEKSIKLYTELITEEPERKNEFEKQIAMCKRAKHYFENPTPVKFENLGDRVNSNAPDYLPLITPDESVLIFSTRREGVVGNLYDYGGYRTADIYTAKHRKNSYSKARSIGSPNTYGNEETAGTSANGDFMLYHVDSDDNFSDIYVSELGRRSFMPPKVFDSEEVNAKTKEPGGSLNESGEVMYFSSDREGGLGGFDIYMVKRLPNGKWSFPKNLGEPINTSGDEKYPFIRENETVLYYASNGHPGMGGLDIFKSVKVNNEWSNPANLGYPINSTGDDLSICFAENPRYAYISSLQPGGEGDLDIYRLVFEDKREELALISGRLIRSDSSEIQEEIIIEVIDRESEDIVGSYLSNPKNGKFNAILPPGNYRLEILDDPNFKDFEKKFNIEDKNDFKAVVNMSLILSPK